MDSELKSINYSLELAMGIHSIKLVRPTLGNMFVRRPLISSEALYC
jgi:hypothetical protein